MSEEKKRKIIMTVIKAIAMIGIVALVSVFIINRLESKKNTGTDPGVIMRNDMPSPTEPTESINDNPHEETETEKDPVYATDRDTTKNSEWEYYIEDNKAVVVRYIGKNKTNIKIPKTIDSYKVSSFTKGVYYYNRDITEISIPDNIKEIPANAFEGCSSLRNIDIADSIVKINSNAFKGCDSLISFTIGPYVEKINMSAFADCSSLKEIKVSPYNKNFISKKGAIFDKSGTTLLKAPVGALETFTIPKNVLTIGSYAFANCQNLRNIKFSYSLKTIRAFGIYKCPKIKTINIGKNVSKIESDAFYGCNGIEKFKVDKYNNTYRSQDGMLISDAKDRIVLYPSGKKDENYTIPDNITYISSNAFSFINLKNLIIPETVELVDDYAFDGDESCTIKINQREELFNNRSGFNWKKYFKGNVIFSN